MTHLWSFAGAAESQDFRRYQAHVMMNPDGETQPAAPNTYEHRYKEPRPFSGKPGEGVDEWLKHYRRKKMKKTERKGSTRFAPDSGGPTQTVKRHSASTNEPQRPAGSVAQPSNARNTNEENNVLLDVARLVDRNITETELRHAGRQKWSTHNKAAVVASIAMLAIVLLMAALVIWREIYAGGAGPGPLCDTNDCLRFAFIVTQSMDRNVDACDDFGTFVCGGARRPQLPSWTPEARDYLQYRWTSNVIESLTAAEGGNSASKDMRILGDAMTMLQYCLKGACDAEMSKRNARDLRAFLEQRRLAWPGEFQRIDVHPLDVLLDLAINWQMPLWFSVGVLTVSATVSALRVDFGVDSIGRWLPVDATGRPTSPSTGSPESNHSSSVTSTREGGNVDGDADSTSAADFDNYVFSTLSKLASSHSTGLEPSAINLGDMDALTPHLEPNLWIASLQKHMGSTMVISEKTQILAADHRLLTTADHFFDKFLHTELLDHMSRCIVNAFSNTIYSAVLANDTDVELNKFLPCPTSAVRARCQMQVEFTYRLPLAVNYAQRNEMTLRRRRLFSVLDEALRAAVAALVHLKSPSPSARPYGSLDATINRLHRLDLDAWPSDDVIRKSHGDLDRMYANFPDPATSHSYLEHLFATRRVMRTLLGSASYHVMMGIGSRGARSRNGFFAYDPFANGVCVWPGAMQEPMFFARGTNAMNYGGIGAAFARQLTAAMDVDEVVFDTATGYWWFTTGNTTTSTT
ncbi:uncharacterized protein LOC142772305 [Rhipicephalus microplus]|uniref:uncharacterized protein LOC142772305 n=1 Tax=Rhipicephalus microplus TaxID=6941 RepID=UPI003F6BBA8D